jgi:hypothetical protein
MAAKNCSEKSRRLLAYTNADARPNGNAFP